MASPPLPSAEALIGLTAEGAAQHASAMATRMLAAGSSSKFACPCGKEIKPRSGPIEMSSAWLTSQIQQHLLSDRT